ncbi:MAG TPA: hypothetical protein VJZ50_00125 [Candidatus Limnocylindrales bacterium]|nr:hypothetical protein [Candidatus Limnocylindrales bacterium]
MAKRVRGSRSAHRPGGQGPIRARRTPDVTTPGGIGVSQDSWDADIGEAIDRVILEETELTIEEPAPFAPQTHRPKRTVKVKADSLDARVAAENVYVREDLRRIGVVSAILVTGLLVAWVLFVALDLLDLY